MIKNIVGFNGKIEWDNSKPDGTPQELLDVNDLVQLDWKYKADLIEGLEQTYQNYLKDLIL